MRRLKKLKDWLNSVPDCRVCGGSGETKDTDFWGATVYWKGKLYRVCYNCKGTGKV